MATISEITTNMEQKMHKSVDGKPACRSCNSVPVGKGYG